MTHRENKLRAVRFETPDHIPMSYSINSACWAHYPHEALFELMESHSRLFPGYRRPPGPVQPSFGNTSRAGAPYRDDWGCVWETTENGIVGAVVEHPLASWDTFASYRAPDPGKVSGIGPLDWAGIAANIRRAKETGGLAAGGLVHGHTFLRLSDIRGYTNLILDMADDEPRLRELIRMVEEFNMGIVRRYLDLGVEWMGYAEDLGMQVGPMVSPEHFRTYIKPSYERLMKPARDAGIIVHMHSDGDIRALAPDLIEGGVQIVNLQDLVNGIDWIRQNLTGKVCVELDVDRQAVTRFGTPAQVDALIREEVTKLGSREGGLLLIFGLYPGTPLANVKALMDAMERYAGLYS